MSTLDAVWNEHDTTPGAIEAGLRGLLAESHGADQGFVPARVLNLVCIVDKQWSGEIANRLKGVGRYGASRTVVCSVSPRRKTIDAIATIAGEGDHEPGEIVPVRETVVVDVGEAHLPRLDTIVDPLVVTDLATVVWAPHGHDAAVDALLDIAQVVLIDTVDGGDPAEALARAHELSEKAYVVDLAWLRSTPWRERLAATFDPGVRRPELRKISSLTIRHHPDSVASAALLTGWLASRLGWTVSALAGGKAGVLRCSAKAHRQDVAVCFESDASMPVRGLAGLTLETASGRLLELNRGAGGLRARSRSSAKEIEREWTIMGASRGEGGILGEGIRQALLRDPTYGPALDAAVALVG